MNRIDTAPITDCTECRHYDREDNACGHPDVPDPEYAELLYTERGPSHVHYRAIGKADGKLPGWCPLPPYPVEPEDVLKEPPVTILGET